MAIAGPNIKRPSMKWTAQRVAVEGSANEWPATMWAHGIDGVTLPFYVENRNLFLVHDDFPSSAFGNVVGSSHDK